MTNLRKGIQAGLGGVAFALVLYLLLALPGVLAGSTSIVADRTVQERGR